MSSLDNLNNKFSSLLNQQNQGKVISTKLKADTEPSLALKIVLNIFTLGIYSLVYKEQHNPEKVVDKINNEVCLAFKNYQLNTAIAKQTELEEEKLKAVINNIIQLTSSILKKCKNPEDKIAIEKTRLLEMENQFNDKIKKAFAGREPFIEGPKQNSYSLPIMNDPKISKNAKDLFQLLFIDLIQPGNIQKLQPLGTQIKILEEKLKEFNQTHGTELGCRKTFHSDKLDPWQTIKITDPTITTLGKVSPLLNELNQILFEKYGLQSNGGDDSIVIDGKQKNTPQCFQNDKGEIIHPQLLLSLIDYKRVFGMLPSKTAYLQALKDAYRGIIS